MVFQVHGRTKAFSIVELLIVIVVIGILAAIVVVGYGAVIGNANNKSVQSDLIVISDAIKLKSLDDNGLPSGGATSSNTGNSALLPGISIKPSDKAYDTTVSNLFYCKGAIGGVDEFAVVARSKSGKAFSYLSNKGIADFSGYTWSTNNNGVAVCTALGFSAPFTWSYGYNPGPGYGWFAWAFNGTILKNLVTNPSLESNSTSWSAYTGLAAPTSVTTTPFVGTARLSAVGSSTSTVPRVTMTVPATAGDVLSLTYQTRSDGQTPTSALTSIKLMSVATELSTFYSTNTTWAPDSNGWVQVTATFTVPSGGNGVRLTLGVNSAVNYSGTLGIDAVMLVASSKIPTYADGATTRWSWSGAINNSTSSGPEL